MLKSAKHEILKYKISRNLVVVFSVSVKSRMLFLLINVKMPTLVGILTFMSMTFLKLGTSFYGS